MKIQKFSFSHHRENWHIDEVSFDDFNLLVGPSGVGKTRILKALELICETAQGIGELDHFEWTIDFFHSDKYYTWRLKTAPDIDKNMFKREIEQKFEIIEEKLVEINQEDLIVIFDITPSISTLNGKELPKLRRTESMVMILSEEETVFPIQEGFKRFIFNGTSQHELVKSLFFFDENADSSINEEIPDISKFKEEFLGAPLAVKTFLMQNIFTEYFNEIKEYYSSIFYDVKDIKITPERELSNEVSLPFEIQDADSGDWISQERMSSGMFRTLTCLIEVMTAPEGSIILIDEFENSLGINCMAELTEFILDHAEGIQFIITSHHPYIINNIPWQDWQIVSRKGNHIRTTKATDITALDTASSLDKFTQLINVLEFEDIAA